MLEQFRGRLTYANVMSTIAVFAVLTTGGAYAASKIGPKDIAKNAVRGKHIKGKQIRTRHIADGAVTARKLAGGIALKGERGPIGLTGERGPTGLPGEPGGGEAAGNVAGDKQASTFATASGSPVGAPDGPSVTVDIPQDAIAVVYATANIDATGSDAGTCTMFVNVPGVGPVQVAARAAGSPSMLLHGNPQFRQPSPGIGTFEMRYQVNSTDGDDVCAFSSRGLWVEVIAG